MSEEIIINLENLNSTKPLKNNEYIHYQKLADLTEFILDTVEQNTKEEDDTEKDECSRKCKDAWDDHPVHINQNPCFFIHGRRGSGKSIFLRGLRKMLIVDNERSCKIKLLANVDPTIFAEGENFFIYILFRITKILGECSHQLFCVQDDDDKRIKEARQLLHQMSKGLQLLSDPKGTLNCSGDADFFFEDSIQNSASGDMLKRNFHKLLSIICKLKRTKALLLTIDDVDLNFNKCSEILETTRKYMFSPHMIIVFAGDLNLYSHAIRGLHLAHFNTRNLDYDTSRMSHRDELVDQLENQYITKFTPVEHRVELTGLDETFYSMNKILKIQYKGKDIILRYYLRKCLEFLYPNNVLFDVCNILLEQPIRSIFQLVRYWSQYIPYNLSGVNSPLINYNEIVRHLVEGIKRTFSQVLIMHKINFSEIHRFNSNIIIKEILLHIGELGARPGSSRLIPTIGKQSEKEVVFYLNSEIVRFLSSYYHVIHYMMFTYSNIHYIKQIIGFKDSLDTPEKREIMRKKITDIYYTAMDFEARFKCPWQTAFFIKATEIATNKRFTYSPGIIRIIQYDGYKSNREDERKRVEAFSEFLVYINKLCNSRSSKKTNNIIHAIYHSICIVTTNKGTAYYLSIFSLLRLIANYLVMAIKPGFEESAEIITNGMLKMKVPFPSLQMHDTYDSENVKELMIAMKPISAFFEDCDKKLGVKNKKMCKDIIAWSNNYKEFNSVCYPVYIDRAWHNFIDRCDMIHMNATEPTIGIGKLFIEYLRAFLEAIKQNINIHNLDENKTIAKCISNFPLWDALINDSKELDVIIGKLNQIQVEWEPKPDEANEVDKTVESDSADESQTEDKL